MNKIFLVAHLILINLYPGIKVGEHRVINFRYTDNTVLTAENKEGLQQLLHIFEKGSIEKRLEQNDKKIELILLSQNNKCPQINISIIRINSSKTREKSKFLVSSDGCNSTKIASRIVQAKTFPENEICTNKLTPFHKKKSPMLLYCTHSDV